MIARVFCISLCLLFWGISGYSTVIIKSFSEWKTEKIQDAQKQVLKTKAQIHKGSEAQIKPTIKQLQQQLSQDEWGLEVVKDLSVTDYLILYLASQPGAHRYEQAAGRMSSGEVAQLLEAYTKAIGVQRTEKLFPPLSLQGR